VLLPAQRAADMASFYLGDHPADDPRASPLFADFAGAPPIWMAVGDTEILRDDTRRLASRLKSEGVSVTVEEAADLPHVWPIFHNSMPEARATLRSLGSWLTQQFSTSGDS
ncbi:MAG: alpha/beta hydrolase fold domain-containing protein, partial [Pseudomonadota bacterium]